LNFKDLFVVINKMSTSSTSEETKINSEENDINSLSEGVQKMELLHSSFLEYKKLQNRIYRHGNPDTVLKCGRKKVSAEHKQATYKKILERRKEERRQKAIAEGRIPGRGRPQKLVIENVNLQSKTSPIQV
jgi:hypothetical protein